jgi:PAS domain S-box-containing protein
VAPPLRPIRTPERLMSPPPDAEKTREQLLEELKALRDSLARLEAARAEAPDAGEAQSRLAALVESSQDAILGKTLEGVVTSWNRGAERLYGYRPDEVVGRSVGLLIPPGHEDELPGILDRLKRGERVESFETVRRRKDGRLIDVSVTVSPIRNAAGTITGASAIARDLTASKRAEQLYRSLLESAPDAMVITDREGAIVLVNGRAETMFGYRREELIGAPVEVLVPERFRAAHVAHRARFIAQPYARAMGKGQRLWGRHKDGREFRVEISLSPLESDSGLLVISAIRDVTERERVLEELRKAEVRYRTLVQEIPAVTFMASLDGGGAEPNELYVSPQIEDLLGFSQKEWLEDPVLWFRQLHPEDRERWNQEFAPTVARGEPFRSVYRFVARDGRVVWVRGEARVVKEGDRPLYLQGVAFDITAIKQAEEELRRLNQTLDERVKERTAEAEQRAQELARSKDKLEVFAYTASHDLKEPLRAILLDTQRLQKLLQEQEANFLAGLHDLKMPLLTIRGDAERLRELLEGHEGKIQETLAYIMECTRLMYGLLEDLDNYSRVGQEGAVAPTDCARVFEAARNILRAVIDDSGAVVTAEGLPVVLGVERELVRLFQNLINNAIKFRQPGRPVRVRVGARRQGQEWLFWVQDNGIGIKDKHRERIFGIGQRSRLHPRSKYPGTGFGLAICKQIVEGRGGRIWVESQPDEGSTFYFTLPAVSPPGLTPPGA